MLTKPPHALFTLPFARLAKANQQTSSVHFQVEHKQASNHVWTRQGREGTWEGRCQASPQGPQGQHPGCVPLQ